MGLHEILALALPIAHFVNTWVGKLKNEIVKEESDFSILERKKTC